MNDVSAITAPLGWAALAAMAVGLACRRSGPVAISRALATNTLAAGCGALLAVNIYWIHRYWGAIVSLWWEGWRWLEYGVFGGRLL